MFATTVSACVAAFLHAYNCVWANEANECVKVAATVPLMPCLVRSEIDGRCSTWELLFSHTASFSLHSHPSSPPDVSCGPANQSHGHWSLLQTTKKKNGSSGRRGFLKFFYTRGSEREKRASDKSSCYCHFLLVRLCSTQLNAQRCFITAGHVMLFRTHY